jgi:hypothetical protein
LRVEGWESLLAKHLQGMRGKPFKWGENDCALSVARWVRTCTRQDYLSGWVGRYKTERGALMQMKKRGYTSAAQIVDEALPGIPVPFARRGDVVMHPNGALGICNGMRSVFVAEQGTLEIDTLSCTKAWRVG